MDLNHPPKSKAAHAGYADRAEAREVRDDVPEGVIIMATQQKNQAGGKGSNNGAKGDDKNKPAAGASAKPNEAEAKKPTAAEGGEGANAKPNEAPKPKTEAELKAEKKAERAKRPVCTHCGRPLPLTKSGVVKDEKLTPEQLMRLKNRVEKDLGRLGMSPEVIKAAVDAAIAKAEGAKAKPTESATA